MEGMPKEIWALPISKHDSSCYVHASITERDNHIRYVIGSNELEMLDCLKSAKNWMHWANEKLGFGYKPVFPEYLLIKKILEEKGDKK